VKRLVVLISGRGSNMEAIVAAIERGEIAGKVVAVISNRADAAGLAFAQSRAIATAVVAHGDYASREHYDAALAARIDEFHPDLVVLAGFMRILGETFVRHYNGRLVNIHPSLLPAFPGLHTHQRALQEGVKLHGCTVHFVTPAVDHGPIIIQAAVPVLIDDDEAHLAARVLAAEHRIFPQALSWFCADRLVVEGERVRVTGREAGSAAEPATRALVSP
jgi:phosphoribosylglycinamide formyltransferase-1